MFRRTTPITALDLDPSDVPKLGNRLVVTGDSITASNCDMAPTANVWGDSWATHLVLASQGALQAIYNAGHGGYTSTQLEALFDTEVVANAPTIVGICCGTNDNLVGNTPSTTATKIKSMIAKARAVGADVFLCTVPPQGTAALPVPTAPTATVVATGGTLMAATYRYKVTGVNAGGTETTASAVGSVVISSGTTNSVTVDIPYLEGTNAYKVYKETSDGSGTYGLVGTLPGTGPPKRFTDTGSVSPGAAPPGSNQLPLCVPTRATPGVQLRT
jgi:lysophospholipase L1-like esterase